MGTWRVPDPPDPAGNVRPQPAWGSPGTSSQLCHPLLNEPQCCHCESAVTLVYFRSPGPTLWGCQLMRRLAGGKAVPWGPVCLEPALRWAPCSPALSPGRPLLALA